MDLMKMEMESLNSALENDELRVIDYDANLEIFNFKLRILKNENLPITDSILPPDIIEIYDQLVSFCK